MKKLLIALAAYIVSTSCVAETVNSGLEMKSNGDTAPYLTFQVVGDIGANVQDQAYQGFFQLGGFTSDANLIGQIITGDNVISNVNDMAVSIDSKASYTMSYSTTYNQQIYQNSSIPDTIFDNTNYNISLTYDGTKYQGQFTVPQSFYDLGSYSGQLSSSVCSKDSDGHLASCRITMSAPLPTLPDNTSATFSYSNNINMAITDITTCVGNIASSSGNAYTVSFPKCNISPTNINNERVRLDFQYINSINSNPSGITMKGVYDMPLNKRINPTFN